MSVEIPSLIDSNREYLTWSKINALNNTAIRSTKDDRENSFLETMAIFGICVNRAKERQMASLVKLIGSDYFIILNCKDEFNNE